MWAVRPLPSACRRVAGPHFRVPNGALAGNMPNGGSRVEHPPTSTTPTTGLRSPNDSYIARGIAVASIGLGFFSAGVFWWTPFSGTLSAVGFVLGVISLLRG